MGNKTALITGASGGIGLEIARELAARSCDLILVARGGDRLSEAAGRLASEYSVRAIPVVADLAEADKVSSLLDAAAREGFHPDYLVNNAGFADFSPVAEAEPERLLSMIRVNVEALTHLTRLFLPRMIAAGGGAVMNVASTAAFQPGPLMAVYYATKAYVLSFSYALANELKGSGVTLTCLCPGPTASGFQTRAAMEESRLVKGKKLMSAARVAAKAVDGMLRGKRMVMPGARNRIMAFSTRFVPRSMAAAIARSMQES